MFRINLNRMAALAIFATVVAIAACNQGPAVQVSTVDSCVLLDVQFLGEYQVPISEITIVDSDERMVWQAVAHDGQDPAVHVIPVCSGRNPEKAYIRGEADAFSYSTKDDAGYFDLVPGNTYVAEIRSPEYSKPARREFTMP